MKPMTIGFLVASFTLTALPAAAQFKGKGKGFEGKSGWLSSYAQGKELAAKTGKPLMVVIRCQP